MRCILQWRRSQQFGGLCFLSALRGQRHFPHDIDFLSLTPDGDNFRCHTLTLARLEPAIPDSAANALAIWPRGHLQATHIVQRMRADTTIHCGWRRMLRNSWNSEGCNVLIQKRIWDKPITQINAPGDANLSGLRPNFKRGEAASAPEAMATSMRCNVCA